MMIAGPPRCPVWCRHTATPIAISQAPWHYVAIYLHNHSIHFTLISWSPQLRFWPNLPSGFTTGSTAYLRFLQSFDPDMPNWIFPFRRFPPCFAAWLSALLHTVYQRKRIGNMRNGGTVLPITNLMADSESGSPDSYVSFVVTIHPPCVVSEIFDYSRVTDGRADNTDHYYSWPPHCCRPANNISHLSLDAFLSAI